MSIKVYTGRMGSGKTYEVVSVVILGALRKGRRVVTNIAGIDYEQIRALLAKEGVFGDAIGNIVSVSHDDVCDINFWRTEQNPDSFVQSGDLLVLDEVWRFWQGFGKDVPEFVMNFFRMHRHFVHAQTGQTCDVALITQDVLDIGRKVRVVVEETYNMVKLTNLGAKNHYRVDIYTGARKSSDSPIRSIQRRYNPEYFVLYQSHSQKDDDGVDAVESNIDERGNLLKGAMIRVIVPAALLILGLSVYFLYGFFSPSEKKAPQKVVLPNAASSPSVSASFSASRGDSISALFSGNRARLAYFGNVGGRRIARVEFFNSSGVVDAVSEDALFLAGWRIYFSHEGNAAFVSNGSEIHHVVSEMKRQRLPRINGVQ
jgi:zona occludens toxin